MGSGFGKLILRISVDHKADLLPGAPARDARVTRTSAGLVMLRTCRNGVPRPTKKPACFDRGLFTSRGGSFTKRSRRTGALPALPSGSSQSLDRYFEGEANFIAKVVQLITSFRRHGHAAAKTDPLGLSNTDEMPPNLRLDNYEFTRAQLTSARPVDVSRASSHFQHGFTASDRSMPLNQLYRRLCDVYASSVGVEYMHIRSQERRDWLRDRLETVRPHAPTRDEKRRALKHLCWADSFAAFCGSNFRLTKRFGLEGCESLVVGMNGMVERAAELGVEYVVMGMPHRGRLNVLANVARKPLPSIFRDFRGAVKGTPVANEEWRAMTEATFEQLCSEGRGGRLKVVELHAALLRLGVPASDADAASLTREWARQEPERGVGIEEFHALTRTLLFPRSVSGDVKYHLGIVQRRELHGGRSLELELLPNPSHLEAVNPLVSGRARAVQQLLGDETDRTRCLPLVLHGDAAFAGQGIVYETLGLSQLEGFSCGGTVHIVINNQIGFTTPPSQARSSRYCTDVAKVVEAPIFHVNGDDVEAVVRVCKLAVEYRQQFGRDVVVDLVCYRRNGHQESDNPSFTQPRMVAKIKEQLSAFSKYAAGLVEQGVSTPEQIEELRESVDHVLSSALAEAKQPLLEPPALRSEEAERTRSPVAPFLDDSAAVVARDDATGVALERLRAAGAAFTSLPADVCAHRVVRRVYEQRAAMVERGDAVDWATAEALAYATLLGDGVHVRMSGQDAERGTFSQRHAVIHDQETDGVTHCPLSEVASAHGSRFEIHNSPLSEFAVLGFELGHSLNSPRSLVVWEAQFGDFANTAQCIIDQFLCAGEAKWLVKSGLVLLLPHGMEGAGPEHSSARLERYLQLCDDDERTIPTTTSERCLRRARRTAANLLVVNLTTPANYFHALRRQTAHPTLRKPLIVMAPKDMLRDARLSSPLEHFLPGAVFEPVLSEPEPEKLAPPQSVRRLLFCSGRVYFDLVAAREARRDFGVAIVRVEQLSPFPYQEVREQIARWPNAQVVWAQEEAMNYGAWSYVRPRLENTARTVREPEPGPPRGMERQAALVAYVGRNPSAAPATGLVALHARESEELLEAAFSSL